MKLVHLTIYARNEEDVDAAEIAKQLASKLPMDFMSCQHGSSQPSSTTTNSRSAASSNRSSVSTPWVPPTPVATDCFPAKPAKDINMDERAKFWNEMRAEEETRRREEVQRKEEQQKTFAEERRQLESQLHQSHLSAATAKSPSCNGHLAKAQSVDSCTKKGQLIAGRTQLFEQKVAEIAESMPRPVTKPKNFKFQVGVANPGSQEQIPVNRQPEPTVVQCSFERRPIGKLNGGAGNLFPTPPKSAPQPAVSPQIPVLPVHPVARKEPEVIEELPEMDFNKNNNQQLYDAPPGNGEQRAGGAGQTVRAKALWDYQAEDDTEISFDPEDIISEVEMIHDGWWRGKSPQGQVGLFPSNYVQLL